MNLKIEGRMPRSSNEIVVSRSLIWELEKGRRNEPLRLYGWVTVLSRSRVYMNSCLLNHYILVNK